jgi:lipoprotein signal peptidase
VKKIFFFLALLLLIDIFSKMSAIHWIPSMGLFDRVYPFGGIPIFQLGPISFSLNYIVNTGAAWGLFAGHPALLFGFRVVVISVFCLYLLFFQKEKGAPRFFAWLIVTGAIGNAIDYVLYGYVIDFLHFTFWNRSFPIFNLADSYITLGVIGLCLFRSSRKTISSS